MWWNDTTKIYSGSSGPITNSQSNTNSKCSNSQGFPDAIMRERVLINGRSYDVPEDVRQSVLLAGSVQNFYFLILSPYSYANSEKRIPGLSPLGLVNSPTGNPEFILSETNYWTRPIGPLSNAQLGWMEAYNSHEQKAERALYGVTPKHYYEFDVFDPGKYRYNISFVDNTWLPELKWKPHSLLEFSNLHSWLPATVLTNQYSLGNPPSSYIGNKTNNKGWSINRPSIPYMTGSDLSSKTWDVQKVHFQPGLLYNIKGKYAYHYDGDELQGGQLHYNKGAVFFEPNFEPFVTLMDEYEHNHKFKREASNNIVDFLALRSC